MQRLSIPRVQNGAARLLAGADDRHVAIVCRDGRIGYGALRDAVARAAAVWRAHGLQPGGRLAVCLPDGIEWAVAWLGAVWAGGVAVGVSPRLTPQEWQGLLESADFDLIVTDSPPEVATDAAPAWRSRCIATDTARRERLAAQPLPAPPMAPEAPAFWVYSSGSSGPPKAVVHTHRALHGIARISVERLGLGAHDRLFSSSRLFFTYPLVNVLLAGLAMGATVLLEAQWPNAATVAESVATLHPTVLFSVPSLYRDLLQAGLAAGLHRAGVARCVSAGEALPVRLREAWQQQAGLPLIDGYGNAETLALVLTALPGDDALRASPGVQVQPLDPAAAAAGSPTRLLLHAATLAAGYHERPEAQAEAFRDGGFCPADLFVRSAGGGWRFAGREDTLVKIRGRWVDLADLGERIGAGLPGLREAAAACVPDADGVCAVALFYVADDAAAVQGLLAERVAALPPHERPQWLHCLPELPRTATGKLLRRQLARSLPGAAP
jgi:acyl-coenzyme A synthetase/AMP-(fatty) acid ligase